VITIQALDQPPPARVGNFRAISILCRAEPHEAEQQRRGDHAGPNRAQETRDQAVKT